MIVKSPYAIINYSIDWSVQYPADTISSQTCTLNGADVALTLVSSSISGLKVLFQLSGGTDGIRSTLVNKIVLASGQKDQFTLTIDVTET